jgi:hypothetical protein
LLVDFYFARAAALYPQVPRILIEPLPPARSTGQALQHAEIKYAFDTSGKVYLYEQNVIWSKP